MLSFSRIHTHKSKCLEIGSQIGFLVLDQKKDDSRTCFVSHICSLHMRTQIALSLSLSLSHTHTDVYMNVHVQIVSQIGSYKLTS